MSDVRVRPAAPEDAASIATVHVRTWQVAYAHVFPEAALGALSVEARSERWGSLLTDAGERERTLVAELDGDVVGFASTGPARDEPGAGELYAIYVLPEWWGAGAGPALMRGAHDALRTAGYESAVLWVLGDNPRARRFYEREGWVDDGSKVETVLGTETEHVRYRLGLT